jgi:GDP-L-fucose synthase
LDCSIRDLAEKIKKVVGFEGTLTFDSSKPDGTPRKLMDVSRLSDLSWKFDYELESGLRHAYQWFLESQNKIRS